MEINERFNDMAEACLAAHEAVIEAGTLAMIALTRALLWQASQELSQREVRRKDILRLSDDKTTTL